jgi:TonB family protein
VKFLVYIFLFFSLSSFAQIAYSPEDTLKGEELYSIVEVMPEFKGGIQEMFKFINKTMIYPKKEKIEKISGTSIVKFTVEASGKISNPNIITPSGNENLDKEALRIVSTMPDWNPGTQKGRPVPVYFNLPIKFNPNYSK